MSKEGIAYKDLPVDQDHKVDDETDETVQQTLDILEEKKQEYMNTAPTKDSEVIRVLELIEEPTILRGETAEERRQRLATLLFVNRDSLKKFHDSGLYTEYIANSKSDLDSQHNIDSKNITLNESEEEEEFYTPANQQLRAARQFLIKDSIERARKRIKYERESVNNALIANIIKSRRASNKLVQSFELDGSQVISKRPISRVTISPNSQYFAAGSWNGDVSVQNLKTLQQVSVVEDDGRGKIGGLDWDNRGSMLISGSEDSTIRLHQFNANDKTLIEKHSFKGHEGRVSHVKFHPTDKYIASASFDSIWRLWDANTGQELLLQEGHSKEVYSIDFQQDGSLLCSGGLDNVGLVWDIRSGKSIMSLNGHTRPLYSVTWCPNAYEVATGGGDGLINIWDVRNSNKATEILAHGSIVTDISISKGNNPYLISSGYDKIINIYSVDNWVTVKKLEGHTDKILTADITNDNNTIISGGWDRSVKLWECHA
ncbi:hypothetical protein C6P45_003162 [Maudiozyma exigua]|uniref:Pre-mRNA processing factor 4 (PRP4)-like domain-containing protein n=1 Tax=Maudiozyma exigua TaxID=34358 RepID=A0A9P6VV61_MAUEX|nr:hypothetical protein C6P45_003162 [Kazachstania exigua]